MNNPFVGAKWKGAKCPHCHGSCKIPHEPGVDCIYCNGTGHVPYDLKGLKWTPEPKSKKDAVFIADSGEIFTISPRYVKTKPEEGWCEENMPLLPSPAEINAQDNPRAVAIAALERAGFELYMDDVMEIYWGDNRINGYLSIDSGDVLFKILSYDPALALYAAETFDTIKQWADAIEWGE